MSQTTHRLAVIILTRNEEKNIADCIASASIADEILVIDSGSTDRTREIAAAHGARVAEHAFDDDGFAGQRNFALTQTAADWVFYLDADERIVPELREELSRITTQPPSAAYAVKRWNIVFGQKMKHGEHGPDWCVRLFPRDGVHWEGVVHERPVTGLPVHRLTGTLDHHTYTDWDRYFVKFNQYTSLMAERMAEAGRRATFADILFHPFFAFVRFYFLRLGFLDGKQGFIFAVNHYFYTMIKYVKLYYRQRS